MNLSIDNISFWSTLAVWAMVVFTAAFVVAKWTTKAPRLRAILLLTALACSVFPFFANQLPPMKIVSVTFYQPYSSVAVQVPAQIIGGPSGGLAVPTPAVPSPIPWPQAMIAVWLFGAGFAFVFLLWSIVKMNRFARRGKVEAPMVAGFPRSRILLPADWPAGLSGEEAEAALAHEQVHLRRFHVQGRVLFELFRCLFWWVVPIHGCARLYEQTLEELADAEAIRHVRPETLASALVKVAAATHPRLATGATSNGKHLQVRLQKIMEKRSPGRWPTAILVMSASLGVAFAAAPRTESLFQTQQEADVKPIFGLGKGTSWTYDYAYGKEHTLNEQTVSKVIPDGDLTVYELVSKYPRYTSYSYAGVSKTGFVTLALRGMAGPGYEKSLQRPKLLRPFAKGASWKWFEAWRGQTMMGPDGKAPDTTRMDRNCVATIEGEEDVTVKAGKFHCYRVKIDETSKADGTVTYIEWISLEVGVVKRYHAAQGKLIEAGAELVKYTPGKSGPG